jgi:hypothetical protein
VKEPSPPACAAAVAAGRRSSPHSCVAGRGSKNAPQKSAFIRVRLRLCRINCAVVRHKDLEGGTSVL